MIHFHPQISPDGWNSPVLLRNQFVLLLFIHNCPTTILSFKLGERKAISKLSESLPELPYHRSPPTPTQQLCETKNPWQSAWIHMSLKTEDKLYIHIQAFQLLRDWNAFLFSLIAVEFRACNFHTASWYITCIWAIHMYNALILPSWVLAEILFYILVNSDMNNQLVKMALV